MRETKQRVLMESSPGLDFRMHYGSIIGMTQYYRPPCAAGEKKRKTTLVSFANKNDTFYFDPSFPTKSVSCPNFEYDSAEVDNDDVFEQGLLSKASFSSDEDVAPASLKTIPEDQENRSGNLPKRGIVSTIGGQSRFQNANNSYRKNIPGVTLNSGNLRVISVLIERKNGGQKHVSTTLERDHDQLGSTKNLVASRLAMFESLHEPNGSSTTFRSSNKQW